MKIDINKKYTSNGKPIRILCTDRPFTDYPVIGMYEDGSIVNFTDNGKYLHGEKFNLVEVWEPQKGELCWFWNETIAYNNPDEIVGAHVSLFDKKYDVNVTSVDGYTWEKCSKYTTELPEHLRKIIAGDKYNVIN